MHVLFLDIDGVLNSRITARKHGSYCIDPILSERFNALVEATNATVVLSSTHRLYEETRCGVFAAGILFEGCMPDLRTQTRADEITAWLREHPEVKRYAVLDDEAVPGHPLFRTSSRFGLTEKICQAVIRHFRQSMKLGTSLAVRDHQHHWATPNMYV
jgi:HAD domain in Swiss Army Knife RNA repair proteins